MWFDKQGKAIGFYQHAALLAREDYKRIDFTRIDEDARVSTIWIGIDTTSQLRPGAGRDPNYAPEIFETEVLWRDERMQKRWRSEAEALAGHAQMVDDFKRLLQLPDAEAFLVRFFSA